MSTLLTMDVILHYIQILLEFMSLKLQGMWYDLLVKHSVFVIRRTANMSLVVSDI